MQELQALIQGKIPPQAINIDQLIELAERYPKPMSAEYKLLELAINIVLASYLEKAQTHL
ncbi:MULTISPECIES: hypothetical protein [Acinetobacter]|uniref:Uncharacterized protein n=1 Tax=Acinetobacter kyonggiensis TaxID=595670 RepID=A0A1H3J503_9GAMM|nr:MULTISPECIES: hypothetical protein [Acinetobacter]OTG97444.1 hypothetical protein B9T24_04820 [Acinetobacter sp. ANC 4654]OTG99862.1 hypothetical protein B9T30_06965 [Acinetobacter sp. ANC 4973]SDY34518.1 hypothetical protein SAMN05421643_10820 [Acinetobacter kyonggiensis]